MKNRFRLYLVLMSLPLLVGANAKLSLSISGVEGKLLDNIQSTLTELNQSKALNTESDEELSQQIRQAMQPYGYFHPQIRFKNREPLQINIDAGPRVHISSLKISLTGEGAKNVEINKKLADLPLAQGQALDSATYETAKQKLINAAEKQGYLHSVFDEAKIFINTAQNTAKIILIFNTGPQSYFGQIQFDPTYISPKLLHRYLPFSYGKLYSTDQILALNHQLATSGYFRSVSVKPEISDNERYIPVKIQLKPASRTSYSVGIGYGTDTGVRGRLGYHVVPVNSAGHKFNAVALGSFGQSILQAQYIIPGKNPVKDEYHITGNVSSLTYNSGYSKSALLSLSKHHNLARFERILSINGLYDGYHYYKQHDKSKFILFPKASFTWKTKNKLFLPSGYNVNLTGLGSAKGLGSGESILQASLNAKAALTIPALRTRFYFHGIQGFTQIRDINHLPLSLALLLGGAENMKGYNFNALGPGKILTYGGIEIQKETIDRWYLVGFLDSGDVYNPSQRKFKHDVGLGLMWVSPIGPIKIGIAQRVDTAFDRHGKGLKLVVNMGPDL